MSVAHEAFGIEDLLGLPDDGNRHELLDGTFVVSPPPTVRHQHAASLLAAALSDSVPADFLVVLQGVGVATGPDRLLVPDLVVADWQAVRKDPQYLTGSDVWVAVEIVSPSSEVMDRVVKPEAYAQAGIVTYWRVELGSDPHVVVHTDGGGGQYAASERVDVGEGAPVAPVQPEGKDPGWITARIPEGL